MCNDTIAQIDVLIRSRTPIIGIVSHEESRIEAEIAALITNQNADRLGKSKTSKRFVTWSIARGFVEVIPEPKNGQPVVTPAPDPIQAILTAGGIAPNADARPTVYLLKDVHPYLRNVPQALRALRDAASALIKSESTIILVGPSLEIPEDAKKDVRIIDFPLPSPKELEEQIDLFVERLGDSVPNKLNGKKGDLVRALRGLTRVEADQVLAQAVVTHRVLDERAIGFCLDAKAAIIRESGALEYISDKAGLKDIGGLDLLKIWSRRAERAASQEAAQYGVQAPRGVLIVGVPGCGKSLTARAIAGTDRPLLRLNVGALFGSYVGQSEGQTRNALKVTGAVGSCTLWIDEIEKALGGGGGEHDGGTSTRVLGTLLTWMEESANSGVFVVATANDISTLRPELIRRFDEVFFVDLPQDAEREEILAIHLTKRNRVPADFDLAEVAKRTPDFTGSELEKVVKAAILRAFDQGREVETEDLLAAAAETVPLSTTMAEGIAKMRDWSTRARPASSQQTTGHQEAAKAYLEI